MTNDILPENTRKWIFHWKKINIRQHYLKRSKTMESKEELTSFLGNLGHEFLYLEALNLQAMMDSVTLAVHWLFCSEFLLQFYWLLFAQLEFKQCMFFFFICSFFAFMYLLIFCSCLPSFLPGICKEDEKKW